MDVGDWLRNLGLGQYEALFRARPSVEERQSDLSCRLRPAPSLQSFAVHDAIRFKGLSGYATRRMYKMRRTSGASDDHKRVGLPSDPLDPAQKTARSCRMDIDVIGAAIS
jgi:hypothetical protein